MVAKTKKSVWQTGTGFNNSIGSQLKKAIAYKPPAAAKPAAPVSPQMATQAVTQPTYGAAGPSATGAETRNQATAQYGGTLSDLNRQLLQAALNYGGVSSVGVWNPDDTQTPVAVQQNDPLSSLAQIARARQTNQQGLNDELTRNGTFASGININKTQELADQESRDRTQAERDYQNAVNQLYGSQQGALFNRNAAYQQSWQQDVDQAKTNAPVSPPVAQPTAVPTPVTIKVPTSTKYPLMANSGPNAGIAYQIVNRGGKRYRQYADGRPPVPA